LYKSYLYIVFFLFYLNSTISQDLSIKFGEKITYNKEYSTIGFFEQNGKKLLFEKKASKSCDFIVHGFNSYLKTESKQEFSLEGHVYIDIIDFLGQVVLFTSYTNNKQEELRAYLYDNSKGFQLTKILHKESHKQGYKAKYILANQIVNQELHILVELPFQPSTKEEVKYLKFDNKLQIVEEHYNKLDLICKPKKENDLIISNSGEVLLMKKYWDKVNNFYIYKLGESVIKEVELKLKSRNISAIDYLFNQKNELVISGFFSSPSKYNYEGYFLQIFDKELQLIHKNQYFINQKIINSFKSSKEIKGGDYGLSSFYITSFKQDTSGNHFLMAEHYGKKTIKEERYINRKGFICIKFNKNGNYVWGCPVETNQLELKTMFGSTFTLNQTVEPMFFYNALENVGLRKGVPEEYGFNNFCGVNQISFSAAGIPITKPLRVDFPDSNQAKFALKPKHIKTNIGQSVFIGLDANAENSMIVIIN
jgi:hypothetical protein